MSDLLYDLSLLDEFLMGALWNDIGIARRALEQGLHNGEFLTDDDFTFKNPRTWNAIRHNRNPKIVLLMVEFGFDKKHVLELTDNKEVITEVEKLIAIEREKSSLGRAIPAAKKSPIVKI